jgi:uncharacterized protein (DUF983 family)
MRMKAALQGRCSYCLEAKVFRTFWQMHEHCPQCGIKYEREQGYFMMAVFVGYALSFLIVIPVMILLYLTIKPTIIGYCIGGSMALLVAAPWIFRYGRIFWLHIDELLDPRLTDDDKYGRTPTPSGIDLMLTHENEKKDI